MIRFYRDKKDRPVSSAEPSFTGGLPALKKAVTLAKATNSPLWIDRVGRMAASVHFLTILDGIEFSCGDQPLNQTTLPHYLERAKALSRLTSRTTRETVVKQIADGRLMGFARPGAAKTTSQKKAIKAAAKARRERACELNAMLPIRQLYEAARTKHDEMWGLAQAAEAKVREGMAASVNAAKKAAKSGDPKAVAALKKLLEVRRTAMEVARKPYSYPVFEAVAKQLNDAGHRTVVGTPFNGPTVCRILQRQQKQQSHSR